VWTQSPAGAARVGGSALGGGELIAELLEPVRWDVLASLRQHLGLFFADVVTDGLLELTDEALERFILRGLTDPPDELPCLAVLVLGFLRQLLAVGDVARDDRIEDLFLGRGVSIELIADPVRNRVILR